MKTLTIPKLKKKAWGLLSKIIRLSYAKNGYVNCYTCNKLMHWKEAQAGHGLSGRGGSILFDTEIIRPQCMQCNVFKNGNFDIFHAKLIKENGLEWFNEKVEQKHKTRQFTRQELEVMIDDYKSKLKELWI